jgi:hypothetical protein
VDSPPKPAPMRIGSRVSGVQRRKSLQAIATRTPKMSPPARNGADRPTCTAQPRRPWRSPRSPGSPRRESGQRLGAGGQDPPATSKNRREVMSSETDDCIKRCRQKLQEGTKMQAERPPVGTVWTMYTRLWPDNQPQNRTLCHRKERRGPKNLQEISLRSCHHNIPTP